VGAQQKWETVGNNKKDAERRLLELLAEIHSGAYREPKPILFSEFAEKWLRDYARVTVKPSTLETYRILIAHRLNPAFGRRPLTQISTELVQEMIAALQRDRGLSEKTALNTLVLLKTILKYAVRWGYLKQNPAQEVERPRVEPREMDFLTPDEIRRLLESADEPYRTLFFTAIMTGMRRGEILGLQWGDIDFTQGRIYVRRSLYWRTRQDAKSGEPCWMFVTPKSRLSRRTIVLSPRFKEALELHRLTCPVGSCDLVFSTRNGTPLDPENMIHQQFLPTLARAGLKRVRFHDLRHTYASLLIAQGENVKFIQGQLGHASATTTLDRYGHLLPDAKRESGTKLDKQIFGLSGGEEKGRETVSLAGA
jgi:integrase